MRARVFVTLKPSVFDPQGRTIAEALHSLGYDAVGDVRQGKYFELELDEASRREGERARRRGRRQLLANPVIESYRSRDRTRHEIRRHRLSRASTAITTPTTRRSDVLGEQAEFVWHKETDLGGADVVILPGGFSHGDYLRTGAIARFSPIMARRPCVRRARRAGARHLQRLPGAARSRPAARRDAAQPRREVPLRVRGRPRRADRHAVHRARAHPGQVLRMPIAHGEGNYFAPTRRRSRSSKRNRRSCSGTRTPPASRPTRPTRTDRSAASPASATARATSSA